MKPSMPPFPTQNSFFSNTLLNNVTPASQCHLITSLPHGKVTSTLCWSASLSSKLPGKQKVSFEKKNIFLFPNILLHLNSNLC